MEVLPDAQPLAPREHAVRLWRLIAHNLRPDDVEPSGQAWDVVLGPLHVATSISEVVADTAYVDENDSIMYCEPAAELEDARSALISRYVEDLTVFVWVWIAFEKAIDILCRRSNDRIGDAVHYIKDRVASFEFVGLRDVECKAYDMVRHLIEGKVQKNAATLVKSGQWLSERHLLFIYIVREARNSFVHGDVHEIEPEDWGEFSTYRVENDRNIVAVRLLTQLSLFALQLLLLASTQRVTHRISQRSTNALSDAPLQDVLQVIHLSDEYCCIDTRQTEMDLGDAAFVPVPKD